MGGQPVEEREEIGASNAGDIGARILQGVQEVVVGRIEEVDALAHGPVVDGARPGEAIEGVVAPAEKSSRAARCSRERRLQAWRTCRRSIRL